MMTSKIEYFMFTNLSVQTALDVNPLSVYVCCLLTKDDFDLIR